MTGRANRFVLFVHFLVSAFTLIAWVQPLTGLLLPRVMGPPVVLPFYEWSRFFSVPGKAIVIYAFVTVSCALVAYSVVWAWAVARADALGWSRWPEDLRRVLPPFVCSWAVQFSCLAVLSGTMQGYLIAAGGFAAGWVVVVTAPFVMLSEWVRRRQVWLSRVELQTHRWTSVVLLAVSIAVTAWMFLPLLAGPLRLLNDHLTAPEQTLLSSGPVTNLDYIRAHRIYGLQIGSAATTPADTADRRASYEMPVKMTTELARWLRGQTGSLYDPARGRLTIVGFAAEDLQGYLASLSDETEVENLRRLWRLRNQERTYTPEEDEFIDKNWLELRWQMLNRWAIHHHNFVFGPMNELRLGKPASAISFQYGYVNAIGLLGLTELFGGFTLENYFRALWLFYPAYLLMVLWIGHTMLRDRRYTALVGLVALASMLSLDYEKILRAPGLSPLRHFLDVPVIGLAAWYWRDRYRPALVAAYLMGLLQIVLNREFGLFLVGAMLAVAVVQACEHGFRKQRFELMCGGLALMAGGLALFDLRSISNYMSQFYAAGFASPFLRPGEFTGSLMLFAAAYGVAIWPSRLDATFRKLALFLALYANGLFLYYVWGASNPHFQNIEPVFALLGGVALKAVFSHPALQFTERRAMTLAQVAAALFLLVPALLDYQRTKGHVDEVFETHVVHTWQFPRAHLQTTMDPKPFEEAVSLIHKYEPTAKGVYFVSVFDNLLPMVADRYSAMPFFDMGWFLLTENEFALARKRLLDEKPLHLFVDHDILYEHSGEVVDANLRQDEEETHVESVLRIRRLGILQDFFRQVSGDYVKIAESPLIDVYERRPAG